MGIRILKAGMMTTVQDLGRTGYQSQGFPVAGVMDRRSFRIANLLVDNPENEPVLEFTLIGPTLQFTADTIIAITGGDFQPTINGEAAPMYTAIYAKKGDILKFGKCQNRQPWLYLIFLLSEDSGCDGQSFHEYEEFDRRLQGKKASGWRLH